jgi:hypothetical protein
LRIRKPKRFARHEKCLRKPKNICESGKMFAHLEKCSRIWKNVRASGKNVCAAT